MYSASHGLEDLPGLGCGCLPDPLSPRKYAKIGPRRIGQHCNELQQVIVWVAKVDRSRRHPGQYDGLFSWKAG